MSTSSSKSAYRPVLVNHIVEFFNSVLKFAKSSVLSLVIISVIFLLLTEMDQALTMVVDLIESDTYSLAISYFFLNALAVSLSHYPVYTYYARDLNHSSEYITWEEQSLAKNGWFKWVKIYIYRFQKNDTYRANFIVNFLRYGIGIVLFMVWSNIVISSFEPNLKFENYPVTMIRMITFASLLLPYILYTYLKTKIYKDRKGNLVGLYKFLAFIFFGVAVLAIGVLAFIVIVKPFSKFGLVLLLSTNFLMVCNYLLFRLLRSKMSMVIKCFGKRRYSLVRRFIKIIGFFEVSKYYLMTFTVCFFVAGLFMIYSMIASQNDWDIANGIPILLANLYFYSFIIATIGKYFFVAKRLKLNIGKAGKFGKNLYATWSFKLMIFAMFLIVAGFIVARQSEVKLHELKQVVRYQEPLGEEEFINVLENKPDSTLFYIASHGGGLKANIWTLLVLNKLQTQTSGKLLNQTVTMSGASGGSLGLALYTAMYRTYQHDTETIQSIIDSIARANFTSIDLTMVLGQDAYRKIWPLSKLGEYKDRPYYSMLKYQNIINRVNRNTLTNISFRQFWKGIYVNNHGYFPSLIMNTAATDGRRGIFWSLKTEHFSEIFPYAQNLADLNDSMTIPFYQAVSTTNRFPIFSPAAKIKGYGHYIDAGAIDNSGLLGCLDLFYHFRFNSEIIRAKKTGIIEIINSKSLYTRYLVNRFSKIYGIQHLKFEENESSTIITDLKTGLNLDKIPGYLEGYFENWEERNENDRRYYFRLFLPHKVALNDVELLFGGQIDAEITTKLNAFLDSNNAVIESQTSGPIGFFENYEYYEPTLSRHLSESNVNYMKKILDHPYLIEQFNAITALTSQKED